MFAVLSVALICSFHVVLSQNTTVRPTYEPAERDTFKFVYEASTHQMLMMTEGKCYIWMLSASERTHIHTDAGMTAVEQRLIRDVDRVYFTKVPQAVLHTQIKSQCTQYGRLHNVDFYIVH